MPLSELRPSHIGRNGFVEEPREGSHEGIPPSKAPSIRALSGYPQTPSSIQSMLKNTTETGDVGQFSIKPARIPSMIHRAPKSPGTTQPIPTKRRHDRGPSYERTDGHQKSMHPHGSNASMDSASYHSPQQSSYRGAQRRSAGEEEDERAYSMTQSSITSQSFSNRPSPSAFQLHDPMDFRDVRPRSPLAYPTRLKRPGYRPSSPALSDRNRPMPGACTAPSRNASFRTASPLSIYAPNRVPPMWQQSVNRSDPMLRYYAPSPRQEGFGESLPTSACGPSSQLPNGLPPVRSTTPTQASDVSVSRRTSPSPSPVFYDYTESFQEDHYHTVSMSSFSLADQVIQEDVPKIYHELDGNVAGHHVAELPGDSNHSRTMPPKYEQDLIVQSLAATEVTRKAVPTSQRLGSLGGQSKEPTAREKGPGPHAKDLDRRYEMEHKVFQDDHLKPPDSRRAPEDGFTVVEKPSINNIPPSGSGQHLGASEASLGSHLLSSYPSSDSMCSLKSSSRNNRQTPAPESIEPSEPVSPTGPYLEIPLVQSRRSGAPVRDVKPPVVSVQRGTSFDGKSDTTEHTEIHAPTPERAASSLSNRKRFSRILSLNEDMADVKVFASKVKGEVGSRDKNSIEENPAIGPLPVKYRFGPGYSCSTDVSLSETKVARAAVDGEVRESTLGLSEVSKKSLNVLASQIPRRSSSRSLSTVVSGTSTEPTIPPRRSSCMRKPAYNLFDQKPSRRLPGLLPVTESLGKRPALTENVALKTADVPSRMKELPPLPRQPTLVPYSPPIDRAASTLPFAFTPLIAPQEDEIPIVIVGSQAPIVSQQNVDNPATPVELPTTTSPKKSIDQSTAKIELTPTSHPEQGVASSELMNVSDAVNGNDVQADNADTSYVQQQRTLPAIKSWSVAESVPNQDPMIPAPQLEPRRISCSAISSSRLSESDDEEQAPIPKLKLKMRADRDSPPRSQPWNLDDSYPWTSQSPKLQVTMPQRSEDPPSQISSAMPRFKLKIQRSSSSAAGTAKISKQCLSSGLPLPANIDVSNDLFRPNPFGRKIRPGITIGQENSSQSPHLQTRFKESFEQPPATFAISPTITLVPPSPGLNLEARSFFSDDSSQMRGRSSLRKRLSQLRAMASRNTISEDGRSYDRAILRSRASGRISKQSVNTAEKTSHFKSVGFKVAEKVKGWFLRGGEKFRGLWRRGSESGHAGPFT